MQSSRRPAANTVIPTLVLVLLLAALPAQAGKSFSFLVLGDTRTEPFLPGGKGQEEAIRKVLKDRFFSAGEKAELLFSDDGTELRMVTLPYTGSKTVLTYSKGWPAKIVTVDTESGEKRVSMRQSGRQWVMDRMAAKMNRAVAAQSSGPLFILHGGDIPLFGFQGATLADSPYWQLFEDELISRLPTSTPVGLPGRLFVAVGNHAVWGDEQITGFTSSLPWLASLGFGAERRIYSFFYENVLFVVLDSGGRTSGDWEWSSQYPPFAEQMTYLENRIKDGQARGIQHLFVVYHKPSYVKVGHDPLPPGQSPHKVLKKYSDELDIHVFNSHTHTTEQYLVDKVNYMVLGGGGAPQKYTETANPTPETELYWQGAPRQEEYNFLEMQVGGGEVHGALHRFRPNEPQHPFSVREVYPLQVQ